MFIKGYFMEPTVFTDVEDHMFIAKEESFGPVMVVSKFKDGYVMERASCSSAVIQVKPLTLSSVPLVQTTAMWTVCCREPMTQSTAWPQACSPATSTRLCTWANGWRLEQYSSTPTTKQTWLHLLEASSSPALAKTLVSKDTRTVDVRGEHEFSSPTCFNHFETALYSGLQERTLSWNTSRPKLWLWSTETQTPQTNSDPHLRKMGRNSSVCFSQTSSFF